MTAGGAVGHVLGTPHPDTEPDRVLGLERWHALREAHEARARGLLGDVVERRRRGERHPVDDFMFEYYRLRPGDLLQWHPGAGVLVEGRELGERRWYTRVQRDGRDWSSVDVAALVERRATTLRFTRDLLTATAGRAARFGCFGMHEWAMVYGLEPGEVRHAGLPLRLAPERVREVVDAVGLRCTHYDAYRFFTPEAAPANALQLTRSDQVTHDQPGCLHVTMDLYKFAGKLSPLTSSELLLDCFELARDVRQLDMQASAYDLSRWGLEPVAVESPEGRAAYVRAQRAFTARAEPLRARLLDLVERVSPVVA